MAESYFVNMTEDDTMVHKEWCRSVQGYARAADPKISAGWHGPYASRGAAIDAALTRDALVKECEACITEQRVNWNRNVEPLMGSRGR